MKISKYLPHKSQSCLILDEKDEIKEVRGIEYAIFLQSREEYENIQSTIISAILQKIEVYETIAQLGRLEWNCDQCLLNHDVVIVLSTNDDSKFELLEKKVKEIMIKNKEFLH